MSVFTTKNKRVIALNILAEFSASTIYTLLYFIFISRYLSTEFDFTYVALSFAIGLSFFASVYIPLHTYRIHILPFISIINALRKRQWRILWHKIPAQMLGALLGVGIFNIVDALTVNTNPQAIQSVVINEPLLLAIFNGFIVGVICYGFYVIRILFKAKKLTGTIFFGLLISVLFFISGSVIGLSALNSFGWLFYGFIHDENVLSLAWYYALLVQVVFPVIATLFVYSRMKDYLVKPESRPKNKLLDESGLKNYDI